MSDAATNGARVVATFAAPGRIRLASLPPLALYVHFPWCVRKCPYCDFNSHEWKDGGALPERDYLDALRADLEHALPLVWGRQVHTVFIGGGTPSLLSAAGLDRLLSDVRALLPLDADAEITLEANPGTFEAAKFAQFRASGVNRLSIGIQSFNEAHLKALGRIHDAAQARAAVEIAARTFENFNLDLMFALPNQTLDECRADLETALAFAPPHLSLYHLTLEPNTYFAKFPPTVPDDDASADMQDWLHERTAQAGYARATRCPLMRSRIGRASTTSTTGASATIWESARARTRSCRFRTGSCARHATSIRRRSSNRRKRVLPCRKSGRWGRAICRSSSC
ncbi:radical SAM superfamily protein [Burkholderia pseudomallei]|nr:radical SAM superfamily protein [Burkholderia pseudomallei]